MKRNETKKVAMQCLATWGRAVAVQRGASHSGLYKAHDTLVYKHNTATNVSTID